ncbi:MAG: lycopene cyclase domain-containing protein [Parvicellaceae bacterium]
MSFLETKYLYWILLLFCIAYPLAQSFEHRLGFYRKWKYLIPGIGTVLLLFIPWDVWFEHTGVWWFNDEYISGFRLLGLPIEEWCFFIAVPFACMFIYEAIGYYVKRKLFEESGKFLLGGISILLIVVAVVYHNQMYTFLACGLTSLICLYLALKNPKWLGRFVLTYVISWIPFILVNGALTGLFTESALVNYNESEIIGLRIFTIPIEDSIYNLLMLAMVVFSFEYFRKDQVN